MDSLFIQTVKLIIQAIQNSNWTLRQFGNGQPDVVLHFEKNGKFKFNEKSCHWTVANGTIKFFINDKLTIDAALFLSSIQEKKMLILGNGIINDI
jgi:hypothetical protein